MPAPDTGGQPVEEGIAYGPLAPEPNLSPNVILQIVTGPVISSSSENSVRITSARVERALGGGSYVTGMIGPSFGYVAPDAAQVHVAAYDANGKLLGEKVDNIDGDDLVRSHYSPNPRAPYTVFFPWAPSQIAKVTVGIQ
jgi:hypothetical protein